MTSTYVTATLPISQTAFNEISAALKEAAPERLIYSDPNDKEPARLDLHGLSVVPCEVVTPDIGIPTSENPIAINCTEIQKPETTDSDSGKRQYYAGYTGGLSLGIRELSREVARIRRVKTQEMTPELMNAKGLTSVHSFAVNSLLAVHAELKNLLLEASLDAPAQTPAVEALQEPVTHATALSETQWRAQQRKLQEEPRGPKLLEPGPHVITMHKDGTEWCVLYGTNLQVGFSAFAQDPDIAIDTFCRAWLQKRGAEQEWGAVGDPLSPELIDSMALAYLGDCGPQATRVHNFAHAVFALAPKPFEGPAEANARTNPEWQELAPESYAHLTPPKRATADDHKVICPSCAFQFRAIPVAVQDMLKDAGFVPPFMDPKRPDPVEATEPTPEPTPSQVEVFSRLHPSQPLCRDDKGVVRYRHNKIIQDLLDAASMHGMDMNAIARGDYTDEDRIQLAQLIGYSFSGAQDLSYFQRNAVRLNLQPSVS